MTPLFKKLNLKDQKEIVILNSPEEFDSEAKAISGYASVRADLDGTDEIGFILTFVKTREEIEAVTPAIRQKLKGDGVVWFAYPKGTSRKYKAGINRDNGWNILGENGFEPVRSVAVDEDWSAVRFRKVEFIRVMKRSAGFAMSEEGKKKTQAGRADG